MFMACGVTGNIVIASVVLGCANVAADVVIAERCRAGQSDINTGLLGFQIATAERRFLH